MITAFLYLSPSTRRFFLPERETDQGKPSGFTLVELLVAMCVSLLLLGGVVSLFGSLGESVNNSKSNSEMLQTMRHTARQLQSDLGNVSLVPDPAQTMVDPQGFFEYVEGPLDDTRPDLAAAAADPELPPSEFVDNQDAGYTEDKAPGVTQSIGLGNAGGPQNNAAYNNNCRRAYSKYLHGYGQWQKTGLESGTYRVSITWPTGWTSAWTSKHESNIPVTITAGDNTESFTVDQTQEPNDLDEDGTGWKHLGEIDVTDGEILVQIGPCGTGYPSGKFVFADAIRIECLGLDPVSAGGNEGALPLVGDCDDVLHFTTKTDEGAHEVVWFCTPMPGSLQADGTPLQADGTPTEETRYRLHRRELKISPNLPGSTQSLSLGFEQPMPAGYAGDFDKWIEEGAVRVPNTLEMLTMRYNRNAHVAKEPDSSRSSPLGEFEVNTRADYQLSLEKEFTDAAGNDRTGNTVILENVIGFDVQAYDPTAPIYSTTASNGQTIALLPTDRGWTAKHQNAVQAAADQGLDSIFDLDPPPTGAGPISMGAFRNLDSSESDINSPLLRLNTPNGFVATYDSWSGDYVKPGDVGFDNDGNSIVDTAEDLREPPPYDSPLKAVQVEIRMQEPESGKVRSVKVRKFLGKR